FDCRRRSFRERERAPQLALPEPAPGLPELRELAGAGAVLGPVRGREAERRLADVAAVPEQMLAAHEVPVAVAPLVGVAVLDRLHDPPVSLLHLSPAVDDAGGV